MRSLLDAKRVTAGLGVLLVLLAACTTQGAKQPGRGRIWRSQPAAAGSTVFPGGSPDRCVDPARQDRLLQQHRRHLDSERRRHRAAAPDHQPGARLRPRVVSRLPTAR